MQCSAREPDAFTPRPSEPTPTVLCRGAVWMILAGLLVFAHGCHRGDHDDELFAFLAGCSTSNRE